MKIPYGYAPNGATWSRTGRPNSLLHIVAFQASGGGTEPRAVCGVGVAPADLEFTSGDLCPKCQKIMGITSLVDLYADPEAIGTTT